ncbi:Hypothetical protein D9617_19g102420 [Elsinoe fawcettii]|nr:Hypothetical protein D9617_19g102420 [Elsinoe fawcettii]
MRHVPTSLKSLLNRPLLDNASHYNYGLRRYKLSRHPSFPAVLHGRSAHNEASAASARPSHLDGTAIPSLTNTTKTALKSAAKDIHIPLSSHPQPPHGPPLSPTPRASRHLPPTKAIPTSKRTVAPVSQPTLQHRFESAPFNPHHNLGLPFWVRNTALDKYHPLTIPAKRQLEKWKTQSFKWNISVPTAVSKRAVVRNWVKRRLQTAIKEALRERGWGSNGEVLKEGGKKLEGALVLIAEQHLVTASWEDVKTRVENMLDSVVKKQKWNSPSEGSKKRVKRRE